MPPRKAAKKLMTVNIGLRGAPRKTMTQKPAESSSESESNHSEKEKPESPTPPATSEDEEKSMKKSRGAKQNLSKKLPEGESSQSKKPSEGESSQSKKPSEGESSQSKKPSEGESSKTKRKRNFGLILSQKQKEVDLAEWIRANPMLYVRTMTAFKDGQKKKHLWADKAEEMEVESGEMLMTWYRSIRTRISKMLKEESKSGAKFMKRTDRDKFLDSNFCFLRECIIRKEGRSAVQLKMKSTLAQKSTPDSSESDMPDVDTEDDTKLDQPEGEVNDGEEPESSGVVADVPTLQAKKKETKGKKGGRSLVKGTKRQLDNESEDDAEIGNMIQQLSQQQKAAASIQNRIEGFLTKDQQSSAAAWGTWMGTLAQQIDVRLHPAMYRQVTDMMLDFIAQSAKLPTHVTGQEIFIPIPPPNPLQPQVPPQDVGKDVPQPAPSYQTLVTQNVPYQFPNPASEWQQQQQWNTPTPAAGQQDARPASTPVNLSMSFSNISGAGLPSIDGSLSEMLLQATDQSTADQA